MTAEHEKIAPLILLLQGWAKAEKLKLVDRILLRQDMEAIQPKLRGLTYSQIFARRGNLQYLYEWRSDGEGRVVCSGRDFGQEITRQLPKGTMRGVLPALHGSVTESKVISFKGPVLISYPTTRRKIQDMEISVLKPAGAGSWQEGRVVAPMSQWLLRVGHDLPEGAICLDPRQGSGHERMRAAKILASRDEAAEISSTRNLWLVRRGSAALLAHAEDDTEILRNYICAVRLGKRKLRS